MNKILITVLLLALSVAGAVFDGACARGDNSCNVLCYSQEKECRERTKDSPNSIDRELCESDKKECLAKCFEESSLEDAQRERERLLKEQEQKALWDSQGYSAEQQQEMIKKRIQDESDREEAEEQRRKDEERRESEAATQ